MSLRGNSAWRVGQAFRLFERVGVAGSSNTFVGRSQVLPVVWREVEVVPGDAILGLVGGDFLLRAGSAVAVPVVAAVSEKHPFEKTYGGLPSFEEKWRLKPLVRDDSLLSMECSYDQRGEVLEPAQIPAEAKHVGRNIDIVVPLAGHREVGRGR